MLLQNDPYRAFMPYPPVAVPNAPDGPLAGLTLAVKDIFDLAGYRTGCGCPTRLAASPMADATAPSVQRLLDAGARFVGKTHTDELAWSMYGMNAHFGTPVNPAAPDRIPGGSSSGSAVAVAAGLADIAIGSDTGGSVRAPASFCGIWGLRPTHGRVSLAGAMDLAPSFDTCGVFARDGATLMRAVNALTDADTAPIRAPRHLFPTDMADELSPPARAILDAFAGHFDPQAIAAYPDGVQAAYETFLGAMMADCKEAILPYIRSSGMPLVRGIDGRAAGAEAMTAAQMATARAGRAAFAAHLAGILGQDGVMIAPATHDIPFRLDAPEQVFDTYRHEAQRVLCLAGMAGLPQVVFPAGRIEGAPFGLSLIGPRGSDRSLVALACRMHETEGRVDA
ncbi:amidase [Paracoccus sp. 1_MG-2023]|uniref:amidase n=1 Tax=unclassified Paracoccus (in: a-proteobacteria) TaxID=2688777 RepID=UPI001C0A3BBB|nr:MULTISPECIES: amidase [unclassified Paracoccus (in: a-proteobacteria)]MBU2958301.1 amidase [Paracoccus sp. C2R09]MDO6668428.1 amidase [Paracoccus sp. 1_MG-2023]